MKCCLCIQSLIFILCATELHHCPTTIKNTLMSHRQTNPRTQVNLADNVWATLVKIPELSCFREELQLFDLKAKLLWKVDVFSNTRAHKHERKSDRTERRTSAFLVLVFFMGFFDNQKTSRIFPVLNFNLQKTELARRFERKTKSPKNFSHSENI